MKDCNNCDNDPTNHGQRDTCWCYKDCNPGADKPEEGFKHWKPLPKGHKFPNYAC